MKQESITPQYRPLPSEKYRVLPFTSLPSPRIKPYAQVRVSVASASAPAIILAPAVLERQLPKLMTCRLCMAGRWAAIAEAPLGVKVLREKVFN